MNKTKLMIRNFVVFPVMIYVFLVYGFWIGYKKGFVNIDSINNYWSNYTELLKFYNTNNLDLVLLSNYFPSYSLFLDPAKLFFNHSTIIDLLIAFPELIPIFYLFPVAYIPILVVNRNKKVYRYFILGFFSYFIFIFYQFIGYEGKGLNYDLLRSVKEVRSDIKWYKNSSLWSQLFETNIVRKNRTKDHIQNALRYENDHNLLLSWFFLQKAKQSGLKLEDLDKNIDRIELALIREYKIQKFYQFLPK